MRNDTLLLKANEVPYAMANWNFHYLKQVRLSKFEDLHKEAKGPYILDKMQQPNFKTRQSKPKDLNFRKLGFISI